MDMSQRILRLVRLATQAGAAAALTACSTPNPPTEVTNAVEPTETTPTSQPDQGAPKPPEPPKTSADMTPTTPPKASGPACTAEQLKVDLMALDQLKSLCNSIGVRTTFKVCVPANGEGQCAEDLGMDLVRNMGGGCPKDPGRLSLRDYKTLCAPTLQKDGTCCQVISLVPVMQSRPVRGRPFEVGGELRASDVHASHGWTAMAGWTPSVPAELRDEIAAAWAEDATHEHASVASFARFLMQLMGLGAPRVLVEATLRAMDDEVRHARACFAIASAYAGEPLGPGPLEIEGGLDALGEAEILRAAIVEGCVGETMAAWEADWKLGVACEPHAREALGAIMEEEAQHAELAWAFVAWMLERRPELGDVARQAFEEACAPAHDEVRPHGLTEREALLAAHGAIPEHMSRLVRDQAIHQVITPAVQELLGA